MTTIRNLEGSYGKHATGDVLVRDRFVGRISAIVEGGVQRITLRDLDGRKIAQHVGEKGRTMGSDAVSDWVDQQVQDAAL